jgi:hypothetical protein
MLPPVIAEQLRLRGHDVTAVKERTELVGWPDDQLFVVAQAEGRTIVTKNIGDFRVLATGELRRGRSHCGLILVDDKAFPRANSASVGQIVTALDAILHANPDLTDLERWL